MADRSEIGWTDSTFNPWMGCEKVSPACARCYAETLTTNRMGLHVWGAGSRRQITVPSNWRKPISWNRQAERDGMPRKVFCASLADVFEDHSDLGEARERLWDLIEQTPMLRWQLLTKRPENVSMMVPERWMDDGFPEQVWLGASVENRRFTWRAEVLKEIPVRVRFLSCEPLLMSLFGEDHGKLGWAPLDLDGIQWVIAGGESGGRRSRPMHPEWVRELQGECEEREIPFFLKQMGSWGPMPIGGMRDGDICMSEDGERYTVDRDYVCAPNESDGTWLRYFGAGPKSGGKLLDGREFCEFPPQAFQLALC